MDLQNLTKKNQEFINIVTHQLIQAGKSDQDIKAILEEYLPDILEKQKQGIPARSFLGAPSVWAAQFIENEEDRANKSAPKNTNPWLMWLDTSLFFLAIVALVTGLLNFFSKQTPTYGIVSILFIGFGGGAVMFASYHFVYRHSGKSKEERPSLLKSIGILILFMFFWMVLYTASSLLPAAINPKLSGLTLLILGAIAFGIRYLLKKKYNIENALAPQQSAK
ncbi:DUF1129 domain-containing protein [Streptococcus devriesei]|uniref:DUF1129 domain-containing protein n=1 Tax=Streptococcus devriesei TaxID=231233 RepID=UPI000408ABE7|nr:DUF1129 family protein [Streptococcus devriesei]